jgi:CRISPR-associated exonuclease Cas4
LLYISGILILVGIFLLWLSGRQRKSSGLPPGRVIYSDHTSWGKVEQPLYDPIFNLTGKPDYMIESQNDVVPVEVKSVQIKGRPYDSHIYQLAAYCLLIEQTLDIRPSHGVLHYPNRDLAIDYSPDLEQGIIALVREIHAQTQRKRIDRSHHSSNRCYRCGYRAICDQSLV